MKFISCLLVFVFFCLSAVPQNLTIKGKVVSKTGEPVPFASVIIKGTGIGVKANGQGEFTIVLTKLPTKLVASSVGFRPKQYKLKRKNPGREIIIVLIALDHLENTTIKIALRSTADCNKKAHEIS